MPLRRSAVAPSVGRLAAALALGLGALAGCGGLADRAGAFGRAGEIAAITRRADAWDKAIVRKEVAAIAANMTEDFRLVDGNGDVEGKAQFVEEIASPTLAIDPYTVEDFEVRLYGDMALVSGMTRMTGRFEGKPFFNHYRYTDVYVRRDGVWKVCNVQITRLSQAGSWQEPAVGPGAAGVP